MSPTTTIKTCEIEAQGCLKTQHLRSYMGMIVCETCYQIEKQLQATNTQPAAIQERVNSVNIALRESQKLDNTIQVRADLFNAATQSIIELKNTIDSDDSITNKPYKLAETLQERFTHFKQVVFELQQQIVEASNQQKAIQVYLNNLANQLRAEEREKLKIQDINYKPKIQAVKVSTIRTAKNKLDKVQLRKYASELGIPEFTLQMLVVSKGLTVEEAANMLRRSIKEAKSESESK